MAVDNPSYFSLQQSTSNNSSNNTATTRFSGFFRRSKPLGKARTAPVLTACSQPRVPTTTTSTIPTSSAGQRRSLRSLFRSASTNSDCERTRQFLKGEPRPSDVAPPSPYLNHRSHTTDRSVVGKSRRRALKSSSELLNVDMVFCGLPSESASTSLSRRTEDNDYYRFEREESECGSEATTVPIDEFEDEQRSYYNLTSTLPHVGRPSHSSMGRHRHNSHSQPRVRRHSVGTFLDQERSAALLNTKQQDLIVEPRTNTVDGCTKLGKSRGKYGTRHAPTSFSPNKSTTDPTASSSSSAAVPNRDDVVFISSKDDEAAALWVNYLTACFEQISRQQGRPPFRVSQVSIEEPLTPNIELKIRTARLQIIVVCPMFLERVSERPEQATAVSRQLCPERVLAMMLGVQDTHVSGAQRANLQNYLQWRKFFVKDQDETFVGQFLGAAVAILGTAATTSNLKTDKTGFSVHPKKVKMGQNRILALLNEPLHPDDTVTVTVDRCGEALEVAHVKRRNPYTLQFSIPERCLDVSMLVGVRIARNGAPLGVRQVKCESRLRELDQILRAHDNPLEFMCQTFGFSSGDKEQLDNWMVHAFQKNLPPHFHLLANPQSDLQISKNHSSSEENPTLLHFAARFGLEKLAWQLLECPGSDIACDMRNANDLTPAELAEQGGHVRLAHQLRGYMQMNEFSNMYTYLKVISERANESGNDPRCHQNITNDETRQEDYCRPRPLSEAYSVPPMARPVLPRTFPDYSTPPPLPQPNPTMPSTVTTTSENEDSATPLASYASSSTLNGSGAEISLQGLRGTTDSASSTPTTVTSQLIGNTSEMCTPTAEDNPKSNRSSQSSAKSRESPQDELIEIITDFKNNVFSIAEVEQLVENWKGRNDVKQSFKDKQRQLSAMRDEYERIQKQIKENAKAATPFDRIRKFFGKSKKDLKDSANSTEETTPNKPNAVNGNLADRRPVSSLSLHSVSSSSSSGRMSTVSGCSGTSLGDSGTHSDTDDRRLQHPIADDKSTGITSYEIPPAPKPFNAASCRLYGGRYTPGSLSRSNSSTMGCPSVNSSELDLRPVKSSHPTLDDKEYYIAFPPCGLPVHSFKPSSKEPKTPSTPMEYANVLVPPPGMCIPSFQYVNVNPPQSNDSCGNVLTVKPEIHAEPRKDVMVDEVNGNENETVDENENEEPKQPDSPKIINTESLPDYTNVQVAASEEIARNFGVTLKKLPGPPVPPRCEFNFTTTTTTGEGVKTNEE